VTATMLPSNTAMIRISEALGFTVRCELGDDEATAEIVLR